jgi:uncharacterized phage protein (TIGR02220 family)
LRKTNFRGGSYCRTIGVASTLTPGSLREQPTPFKKEYNEAGLLFLWTQGAREWGYFVSFDQHHNYCNKTNADDDGKRQKHRRKTPEPPSEALSAYLKAFFESRNTLGQDGTCGNKKLNPNPNPNPNPNNMSGKPDASPSLKDQAREVLKFLNERTGKNFHAVDTNLDFIVARLRSGASVQDCKSVIAKKRREWIGDPKMAEYLRPATLFNKTKFEQYRGELVEEAPP